jgi:hypothetical protein
MARLRGNDTQVLSRLFAVVSVYGNTSFPDCHFLLSGNLFARKKDRPDGFQPAPFARHEKSHAFYLFLDR